MHFRKDINGLRAIAVIAVVLFHFNEDLMTGGFAGVDVFFVISGYLMTGIIFTKLEINKFSLLQFYISRANRIIPPLAFLCIVLLIFGWFYLTPIDYKALGKHIVSSMSFLSNIIYWSESGYFDNSSHEKWLLHTWSLSAEWQFYIIYPLVLLAIKKCISTEAMKFTVLVGAISGAIFCAIVSYKWPSFSYFLLPTRAWEMMVGGVAYLYPIKATINRKKAYEYFGLTLIVVSYVFITKDNVWPGFLALLPVLGAFVLIQANRSDSLLTGNIVFQALGKWSYSIYLWHWPLVVFFNYYNIHDLTWFGLILSVFLGYLSFHYIESQSFKFSFDRRGVLLLKHISVIGLVSLTGLCVYLTRGAAFHYPESVRLASNEGENSSPYSESCFRSKGVCYFIDGEIVDYLTDVEYIIFGDSHSLAQLSAIIDSIGNKKSLYIGSSACLFIPDLGSSVYDISQCQTKTRKLYDELIPDNENAKLVSIHRMNIYFSGYGENESENKYKDIRYVYGNEKTVKSQYVDTMCELSSTHDVFVTKPTPEFSYNIPREVSKRLMSDTDNPIQITLKEYQDRNKNTADVFEKLQLCDIKVLDPIKYICSEEICFTSKSGRPIYKDDDHLSEFGNRLLMPMFSYYLRK
ncbi:acyltransferase family protein [Cobetia sp. 1AS1]|uniref:acyltransferase family protein n=1 Tax=Cobetia sp. 1AS1 TaxID=3040016 RepID=UPI00244888C2|nr:acyltransferase family protein [Cobetia sp. 1AS1]MDH2294223.1 acyltransferase family protein [Cobetia sp. 1AS1]